MARKPAKRQSRVPGPALADPGDPLVAPDGQVLQPIRHPNKLKEDQQQHKIDPLTFRGVKQHNVRDLPAPANMMHGIGAVLMYSIMNVGDREIADQLKISVEDVIKIREHPAYSEVFQAFFDNVISAHGQSIVGRIASYAQKAADKVAHLAFHATGEKVQLDASRDILDRGGFRPKDVDQKQGMQNNTLRIQINRADGSKELELQIDGVK